MIADMLTVALKEWKEMLKGGSRGRFVTLFLVAVYGIFIPLQTGRDWVTGFQAVAFAVFVPLFLVFSVVADAFAGERERHTLETLLASRLTDRAILIGKVLAVTVYGWGLTMCSLILGAVVVNVAYASSGVEFYPAGRFAALVGFSFLVALLAASLGVLVSLRAATVRQATQVLTVSWLIAVVGALKGYQQLSPATQQRFIHWIQHLGIAEAALIAALVLLLIDGGFLAVTLARFQRARLILD